LLKSDRHRWFEITAVVITGLLKFLLMDILNLKFIFISVAILFWSGYVILQVRKNSSVVKYWGFTLQNFRKSLLIILPVAFCCIAGMIVYAMRNHIVILNPHIIPILLLYPLWGFIQQFLVVGLVAGNLNDLEGKKFPVWIIVTVTSILFCLVHYPSLLLMIATFLLALFYTLVYLRHRNLITLGLFHGWLGCFFMFYVLNRDPWDEVFASMIK